MSIKAPQAKIIPHQMTLHGDMRTDNYYWMRDDERQNPEIIDYLNLENEYTQQIMAHTQDFQEKLFQEIKGRIKENDESMPYFLDGFWFYNRYETGKEYPIYCRKKEAMHATEEVIFDVNIVAKKQDFYHLNCLEISQNHQILAYAEDTVGRRIYTLKFRNLATNENYPEQIQNTSGNVVWALDNQTVFYVVLHPKTLLPYRVFRHELGTDPTNDVLVYEEKDATFYLEISRTKSKKYILIHMNSTLQSEVRWLRTDNPKGKFTLFFEREPKHEYSIDHFEDRFYIRTNWEAQNFRLMEVPEAGAHHKNQWKEVIAHRPEILLEDLEIFQNHLVLTERKEGLVELRIINQTNKSEHYLNFGESTYMAYVHHNPEGKTTKLRYGYSSLTTPNSVFEYDMNLQEKTLLKQQEIIGDFRPENYQSERLYAPARDGIQIPISLVYRKDKFRKNAENPILIYAYGSYGLSMDAYFSLARISLLDRGFCFAIAHVRGGEEMGRKWYEDGKLLQKKNTFFDFIDTTKYLISEKYAHPDKVFAMGGSAGGLLMGVVANWAGKLYKGIIAAVPFVDVITTMLDETIPLTTGEFDEWGNPKNKIYYEYMRSYSPYDQVQNIDYPNILVTSGFYDSQVQYWEPTKWIAKLRAMKTDTNRVLLHTNMEAGHGGVSGRFRAIRETALEYAFMLDLIGIYQ